MGRPCRKNERSSFKILSRYTYRKETWGVDNIRMDLKGIGISTRNWVDSAQDRDYWRALVNAALNLRVPQAMELVAVMEFCHFFAMKKRKSPCRGSVLRATKREAPTRDKLPSTCRIQSCNFLGRRINSRIFCRHSQRSVL